MNGWLGQRTPTVVPPAVTASGISSACGNTIVRRAGPERPRQLVCQRRPVRHAAPGHSISATWTMIGIVGWTTFDLENFGDGVCVQRVGGEAVDRFRGQRDDFPGAEQIRRALDGAANSAGVCVDKTSAVTHYS